MDEPYPVEPLDAVAIDRAFLVLQTVMPTASPGDWQRFCSEAIFRRKADGSGPDVLVARNRRGYILGIAVFVMRAHDGVGTLVDVPVLATASVADPAGVAAALLRRLKEIGHARGGRALRFRTQGGRLDWSMAGGQAEMDEPGLMVFL